MTDFELSQAKKELGEEMRASRELTGTTTPEQKKRYEKLLCVGMINSVIAYEWREGQTAKELLDWELHDRYHSYLEEYVNKFGYDEVLALVQGQLDDVKFIERDVFTDSEGLSYNSITWKNKNEPTIETEREVK